MADGKDIMPPIPMGFGVDIRKDPSTGRSLSFTPMADGSSSPRAQ